MKPKKNRSFGARVSLAVMTVINIFFVISIAIISVFSHIIMSEEAKKSAQNLLQANLNDIEKEISNVELEVKMMSTDIYRHLGSQQELYAQSADFLQRSEAIMGTAIAFRDGYFKGEHFFSPYSCYDADGGIRTIQLGNDKYDYFSMDWYDIPAKTGEPVWVEPYFDEGGGQMLMSTYSYPLKDKKGEVFAVMTADVSLEDISAKMSQIKPYKDSYTLLVSKNGKMLSYEKDSRFMGKTLMEIIADFKDPALRSIAQNMLDGNTGTGHFMVGKDAYMAVYGHLKNGWSAITICPYREVLKSTSMMNLILILLGLVGMTIVFILCYVTIRRLTKPLELFSQSAMEMSTGNFNASLPVIKSKDEIQQLRDSFEHMQHSLTEYMESLKQSTAANERIESELNIARQIQQDMLPHDFPANDKVDLTARLIPAKEVGGDLYDYILNDSELLFVIGDVSGKGVPASLIMAITKSACSFADAQGSEMDSMMARVNRFIAQNNATGNFVTLFIGRYSLNTHILEYCNAGHNPIIICDPQGEPRYLKAIPNIAIGLFPEFKYNCESLELAPGSSLLLYTDGVTEAEDKDKKLYGEERLLEAYKSALSRGESSQQTVDSILADVKKFTGENAQNDDITIMSIKLCSK